MILEEEPDVQDDGERGWEAAVLVSLHCSCLGGGSRLGACWTLATAGPRALRCLQTVMSSVLEVGFMDGLSADNCTDSL